MGAVQQQACKRHQVKYSSMFSNEVYIELLKNRNVSSLICRFICHGLMTGETYVFRVRAVNAAGLSQFSQESEPVKVKAAIGESN